MPFKNFLILYAVITATSVYLTRGDEEDHIIQGYLDLIPIFMALDWHMFSDVATYTWVNNGLGIGLFIFIKSIFICVIWLFLRFLFRRIRRIGSLLKK